MKAQVGWIVTAVAMLIGAGMGLGQMRQMCVTIDGKADKAAVTRELDLIQATLDRIETKLDNHMAKITP